MIVTFTAAAEADLEAIADWIAGDDPLRAVTFVLELRQNCEVLSDMPRRFPLVPRYEDAGIRRKIYRDYLIFYRILSETVEIVHIFHGARDYEQFLLPEQ